MKDLKERFENNYLLGCIKYKGQYDLYLMPIAWWILNHKKYDPEYDPKEWETIFRGNILNVTDENVEALIINIEEDKVNLDELRSVVPNISSEFRRIIFFVDFDSKLYVENFCEIDLESYLPDSSWEYMLDYPVNFLPKELSSSISSVGIE
jgi:hypothetical protein